MVGTSSYFHVVYSQSRSQCPCNFSPDGGELDQASAENVEEACGINFKTLETEEYEDSTKKSVDVNVREFSKKCSTTVDRIASRFVF